jgi:hypothetical protein
MQLGDHLGFAGLAMALIGIAIAVLWPNKRWIGYLCLVGAVGLLIWWGTLAYKAKTESPVDVTPQKMKFTSAGDTYTINVENTSNVDVYAVALLLLANNDATSKYNFDVRVPDDSLHELEGNTLTTPVYDLYGMACRTKLDNKLAYVFSIDHMAPHEVRHIILSYKAGVPVDIAGKITYFATEQPPISSFDGKIETRKIKMPLSMDCDRNYIFRPKQQ